MNIAGYESCFRVLDVERGVARYQRIHPDLPVTTLGTPGPHRGYLPIGTTRAQNDVGEFSPTGR